jgi:hypothetical protein
METITDERKRMQQHPAQLVDRLVMGLGLSTEMAVNADRQLEFMDVAGPVMASLHRPQERVPPTPPS